MCVCVRGVIVAWWDDAVVVLTVMVPAQGAMAAQAIKQVIFIKSESILFYTIRLTCVHTLYKPGVGQMLFCFTLLNVTWWIYHIRSTVNRRP